MRVMILSLAVLALAGCRGAPDPVGPPPGAVWTDVDVHVYPPSSGPAPASSGEPAQPECGPSLSPCPQPPNLGATLGDPLPTTFDPSFPTSPYPTVPATFAAAGPDLLRSGVVGVTEFPPDWLVLLLLGVICGGCVIMLINQRFHKLLLIAFVVPFLAGCQSAWTVASLQDVEDVEAKFDQAFSTMDEKATAALLEGKAAGEAALAGISQAATFARENPTSPSGGIDWVEAILAALGVTGAGLLGLNRYRNATRAAALTVATNGNGHVPAAKPAV